MALPEERWARESARKEAAIAEMKQSPYWDKKLPGMEDWTVGKLILQNIEGGSFDFDKDTPESIYNGFEAE
jgi:hypothetical protein